MGSILKTALIVSGVQNASQFRKKVSMNDDRNLKGIPFFFVSRCYCGGDLFLFSLFIFVPTEYVVILDVHVCRDFGSGSLLLEYHFG